jgi:hypothetical protein
MYNIDEILARSDLRALVERAGGQLKKDRCPCPIHGGHEPTGFSVYHKDGRDLWQCFSGDCGGGDAIRFVEVWQQKTFKQACLFLGGDILADPIEMEQLARHRHAKAVEERKAAEAREEARRKELQAEEKHLFYHNQLNDYFIDQWDQRGINTMWQGFFYVGGCADFSINAEWKTPTLTIPIFNKNYEVLNIKHRLLNPQNPKDKYRPERSGLGSFPSFMAFPDRGYDGSITWVIEGEIKAMVTATITPNSEWQFIGVPGRSQYKAIAESLKGKNVIVVPDPGAEKDAAQFCKAVNGRWLTLPQKIDDMIVEQGFDGSWLLSMEKQARRIR